MTHFFFTDVAAVWENVSNFIEKQMSQQKVYEYICIVQMKKKDTFTKNFPYLIC